MSLLESDIVTEPQPDLPSAETDHSSIIKQVCLHLVTFVTSDQVEPQVSGDDSSGWCTEPRILHTALSAQHDRADNRLLSLTTMYQLLTKFEKNHVLDCIHQHLLVGYFSLCNMKTDDACTQLHHYLEGIQAAPGNLQEQVQGVVHNLYNFLIECLKNCGERNKQMQLLLIFALSTRYRPKDLNLVIKNELMGVLTRLSSKPMVLRCALTKPQLLNISARRLIHIVTIATCLHAKKVDLTTVEEVVDKLYLQLINITENYATDHLLGDYLVFLRTLISEPILQKLFTTSKWIVALLSLINVRCEASNYVVQNYGLRPKLLVLQLLQKILTNDSASSLDRELMYLIVDEVFEQMVEEIWNMNKENKNYEVGQSQVQVDAGCSNIFFNIFIKISLTSSWQHSALSRHGLQSRAMLQLHHRGRTHRLPRFGRKRLCPRKPRNKNWLLPVESSDRPRGQGQRGHLHRGIEISRSGLQSSHDRRHVAVQGVQRQSLPQR